METSELMVALADRDRVTGKPSSGVTLAMCSGRTAATPLPALPTRLSRRR